LIQTTGSTASNQSSDYYTAQSTRRFFTQQLRGPARARWASYLAALPTDHHVAWDEFRVAFRGHHLSAGTICHKLVEFLELR
jgi:hypothetical protein